MIDAAPFSARLDAALAMNGLDNATFAAHFGPNGQQKVYGWRVRERIGQPSVAKVRDLLPRTNIDWLQEGVGEPERFSAATEPSRNYQLPASYAARLDLPTLAKAVRVMTADEEENGAYSPLLHATRLLEYYDQLAAGEKASTLLAKVLKLDDEHGGNDDEPDTQRGRK